ncbi:MAG: hypothetical protein HQK74_11105 [Desulfamplus sp.]|nr:hypothetical protein [Desulfamplus sp.]
MDIDAMLESALKEREKIILAYPLLQEFQDDIDRTINGFKDSTKRLESLALAARNFNIKRGIPQKIANL